ncbi:MAG: hypothetical protein ACTSU5_21025 [Promethearchaeota archaeon]
MAKKRAVRRKTTHKMVHVGPDRRAEGESFADVREKPGRFFVSVSLVNLRTVKVYDIIDRTSDFYFKVDGGKAWKSRVPNKGTFQLRENQDLRMEKNQLTLWSELVKFDEDDEKVVQVRVQLREQDPARKDKTLAEETYEIKCPMRTKYVILQTPDEKTKAKLRLYAAKTLA